MRRRRVLVAAMGVALLLAGIGGTVVLFRPSPPLGPTVNIPADVWVAVDPATFGPDVSLPPRVVWPPKQDLEAAGFEASSGAGDSAAPDLSLQWNADLGARVRHRLGLGSGARLSEFRIRFAACDESRTDERGTWRRYRGRESDVTLDSTKRLLNLGPATSAPTGPIVIRFPGSMTLRHVLPAGSTPSPR